MEGLEDLALNSVIRHERLLLVMKKEMRKHIFFFSFKELSHCTPVLFLFSSSSFICQKPHTSFCTVKGQSRLRLFIKRRAQTYFCACVCCSLIFHDSNRVGPQCRTQSLLSLLTNPQRNVTAFSSAADPLALTRLLLALFLFKEHLLFH